ncbi:MAG TPA: ABC transporter substrate-binding protein [Stellaceae bacterium]|nr:ABC transporter substrate-binding protein [Stellaceae bacterium]
MSRFLLRPLTLLLALLLPVVAAHAEDLPATIRFGGVGAGYGLPFGTSLIAIAHVKGFVADQFKGTPVKLQWNYFTNTGPAINEAFANQQLDFAQYGVLPQIIARANGVQTRLLLSGGGSHIYAAARSNLPIHSIADLKGHTVTLQKATILHWALLETLAAHGLSGKDVTILDLKGPDQLAALAAGSVDATFGTTNLLTLRDKGVVRIFYESAKDPKAVWPESLLVSADFEKRYPGATERVVRGFVEAAYWLAQPQNHDEAIRIWAKSGLPEALLVKDFAGDDFKNRFTPLLDPFVLDRFRKGIAFARDQRLIRHDVDINQWVDGHYLDAALKASGHEGFWHPRGLSGLASN